MKLPLTAIVWLCCLPATVLAQVVDAESVSRKLCESTVTVRIAVAPPVVPAENNASDKSSSVEASRQRIVVQSGVLLGNGLIVTFSQFPPASKFRVTLPDGAQAEAQVQVIDLYSGLSLLAVEQKKLPGLELAESLPNTGKAVLTAAASGLERPAVSLGILGGADRTLAETQLPPLLQCDVRTTETSSGAAVVDADGKLVGVVAVVGKGGTGWTYAVPVGHVQRLLRARMDDKLVVLYQQRPAAGLRLVSGKHEGEVLVERVEPRGAAEEAGIRPGDEVLEIDGVKIRSVYQFVGQVMKKQPGDRVQVTIRQGGMEKKVGITLRGGEIVDPAELVLANGQLVRRAVEVRREEKGEVVVEGQDPGRDATALLQEQVRRFAVIIEKLRQDLRARDDEIRLLQQRLESLEKQLSSGGKKP